MDCPACSTSVTIEVGPERPLSTSLRNAVLGADEEERIEVTQDCWNCGWHETRELCVASIDTTAGDAVAIERAALVDEITEELSTIDNVEMLEETLAAIRRQRGTDSAMSDTDDDAME